MDKKRLVILVAAGLCVIAIVFGAFYFYKTRIKNSNLGEWNQSETEEYITTSIIDFREEDVLPDDRDIYYLKDGNIWATDVDQAKRTIVVDAAGGVEQFSLSPDGKYLYWIDKGELWKQGVAGGAATGNAAIALVRAGRDIKETIQETGAGPLLYLKGKALNFWVSPDGNYIAYTTVEDYTGCCGPSVDIPRGVLNIMKNDGSEKMKIVQGDYDREVFVYLDWAPDSEKVVFTSQALDEATQGSPYRSVDRDGNQKLFMDYYEDYGGQYPSNMTISGTKPIFSPDGKKIVYMKYPLNEEISAVWLTTPEGSPRKEIFDFSEYGETAPLSSYPLQWSDDGNIIILRTRSKIYFFDENGFRIGESKQAEKFDCSWCDGGFYESSYERSLVLLSDDFSFWSSFKTSSSEENEEIDIIFNENFKTGSRTEYKIKDFETPGYIDLKRFSDNKLYYTYTTKTNSSREEPKRSIYVLDIEARKNYLIVDDVPRLSLTRGDDPERAIFFGSDTN